MAFVIGAFLLLLTISYLLARPLVVMDAPEDDRDPSRARDDLVRRIADLDFDLATGNLAEDDHARLRADAVARAVAVLAAARQGAVGAPDEEATGEPPAEIGDGLQDDIERLVSARRRVVDTSAR